MVKTSKSRMPRAGADEEAPLTAEGTGTVHRVLRLLSTLPQRERWALADLARALELPRPTTHRLLALCRPLGFVEQDGGGAYSPGVGLFRLAGKLAGDMPIKRLARPILEQLRDRTNETAILTVLVRAKLCMFYADTAAPSHPMRYAIECNQLQPLSWGASGRSLLAYLGPAEIDEVVERADPSPLDGRRLDVRELRTSLAKIRKDGCSVTHAQRTPNAWGLAVPFFDGAGQVRGNLTFTIPEFRHRHDDEAGLLRLLREAAAALSQRLGWA